MLLGNKEQTIKLYAENFLWGNITFDYGIGEGEREILVTGSKKFDDLFQQWLREEEDKDNSENHKRTTNNLYSIIFAWRVRGRLKGLLRDEDLETKIKELQDQKTDLENKLEDSKQDNIKIVKEMREQDRIIANLEAQIFYLKKE